MSTVTIPSPIHREPELLGRDGKPLLDFKQRITQHRRNHNASFTQTTGIG
jgi:hypothetical protein